MSFTHDFDFDPSGGYSREQLLNLKVDLDEPADFADFWRQTYAWAMHAPLNWTIRPSSSHAGDADTEVFDIEYDSLLGDGNRIGGWLTLPRKREPKRGVVFGHGYGGREAPEPLLQLPPDANAAAIYPVCTGLPTRSTQPAAGVSDNSVFHVLHGIGERDSYIHRHCTADIWRAASVLHEVCPELVGKELDYLGASFGGGIGALALPWDARFSKAHLLVPSFGNHPLRLQIPCSGSGEAVRLYVNKKDAGITRRVLPYFDAAIAARHIRIPVHVGAAFFDPAVTPVGQFSVYHSLGGPKELYALQSGHFEHSGQAADEQAMNEALRKFFA